MSLNKSAETVTRKFRETLETEAETYGVSLSPEGLDSLSKYYELLNVWNSHLHLVAPCSPRVFATRHILESLLLLKYLPEGVTIADVGSGAGLPLVPCLIVRSDLSAVFVEASKRKAVFIREALNHTATADRASVIAERFEKVPTPQVDFVTCRALERFEATLTTLLDWSPTKAKLLLFGGESLGRRIESSGYSSTAILIPNSKQRFLFVVTKD
jgi:16S rRNA (guanine527-N7)-methyltransferase